MKLKCIIIEDEPLATEKLKGFVSKVPVLELLNSFDNGLEALSFLKEYNVDLIFLDIQMKEFDGIQFLETICKKICIIITSAYDQYALRCYEFHVNDYLLKPYSFERFVKSVDNVAQYLSEKQTEKNNPQKESIFVNTEYRIERLELKDILYIEGMKDYLKIVTNEKNILTLKNFSGMQELLPEDKFVRTHKSYIVSLSKIESIERNRIKIGKSYIPISETYKANFYELIEKQNRS